MQTRYFLVLIFLLSINFIYSQKDKLSTKEGIDTIFSKALSSDEVLKSKEENIKLAQKIHFQYLIIKSTNDTYGYRVYADGQIFIDQPMIPGSKGLRGFQDIKSAEKAANLVIDKIKLGEMPPTLDIGDFNKIGIIIDQKQQ